MQEKVNDINLQSLSLPIDTSNLQTPLNLTIDFETGGPVEVSGDVTIDIKKLSLNAKLTLKFDLDNGVVDLMAWMQDISKIQVTLNPHGFNYNGIFLGNQISGSTVNYDDLVQNLIDEVPNSISTRIFLCQSLSRW